MLKVNTINYRKYPERLTKDFYLFVSSLNCDYYSARSLILLQHLNKSALCLIAQFLEKSVKQIIILNRQEDIKKYITTSNQDIYKYMNNNYLFNHNTFGLIKKHSAISAFKKILDNSEYSDFIEKISDMPNNKHYQDIRYGNALPILTFPNLLYILDELAKILYDQINIRPKIPESMYKLFIKNNKSFTKKQIDVMLSYPDEKIF